MSFVMKQLYNCNSRDYKKVQNTQKLLSNESIR